MTTPYSTCFGCGRPGIIDTDQRIRTGVLGGTTSLYLEKRQRFHCQCGREWLVDAAEAEFMGRFLDRARLR